MNRQRPPRSTDAREVFGSFRVGATSAYPDTAMVDPAPGPEFAHLMGTLQTLTHKMALSADAGNAPRSAFYLYESLEQMRVIQREAPEYENLPVAVLVDRIAVPAYNALETATAAQTSGQGSVSRDVLVAGLDRVVQACNECHAATQHGFIQITRGTEVNPFHQSFKPSGAQ